MHNIVLLDGITLPQMNLNFDFPYQITKHEHCPNHSISDVLQGQDIAITNKVPITRQHMESNPQLKMIAVAATGYNHIDVIAAKELGVIVSNVAAYSTTSVAEHCFMLLLALAHKLPEYASKATNGEWQNSNYFSVSGSPYYEIRGKTIAIIGNGGIGAEVARLAHAFGMHVIFVERKSAQSCRKGYISFNDALHQADIITLHCPLNSETTGLIGKEEIHCMKTGAILLNVGRGGLVDELALANALISGKLSGAGMDVLSSEPPTKDNPLLKDIPNLLLTPHTAWRSEEALSRLYAGLEENINCFVNGTPKNCAS